MSSTSEGKSPGRYERARRGLIAFAATAACAVGILTAVDIGMRLEDATSRPGTSAVLSHACPVPDSVLTRARIDEIDGTLQSWTNLRVPRDELERRLDQVNKWLSPLERTAEQLLGCDADEDIQQARRVAKEAKLLASAMLSLLSQSTLTPTPSPS
jgi:hypothetical protein